MPEPIQIVEALLFASDSPVEPERIREVLELRAAAEARALVEELKARYDADAGPFMIVEVGGGYRMVTRAEFHPWLVRLARSRSRSRLSRPALETLAIVAYRQPISRPEVDAVRGVNSDSVLDHLLERRLIRIQGRKDAPGRPFVYETTREFLVAFGLRDVADLPKVEGALPVLPAQAVGAPGGEAEGGEAREEARSVEDTRERSSEGDFGSASLDDEDSVVEDLGPSGAGLATRE